VAAGCLVMSDVLAAAQDYFRALYAPDHDRVREVASPAMTFADPTAEGQAAPPSLMNSFINEVNRYWETTDVLSLASYCLWRLNHVHPFINGNGRTARALRRIPGGLVFALQ